VITESPLTIIAMNFWDKMQKQSSRGGDWWCDLHQWLLSCGFETKHFLSKVLYLLKPSWLKEKRLVLIFGLQSMYSQLRKCFGRELYNNTSSLYVYSNSNTSILGLQQDQVYFRSTMTNKQNPKHQAFLSVVFGACQVTWTIHL
jgi:hypothetical protein